MSIFDGWVMTISIVAVLIVLFGAWAKFCDWLWRVTSRRYKSLYREAKCARCGHDGDLHEEEEDNAYCLGDHCSCRGFARKPECEERGPYWMKR